MRRFTLRIRELRLYPVKSKPRLFLRYFSNSSKLGSFAELVILESLHYLTYQGRDDVV
jgi:hypothetical protein